MLKIYIIIVVVISITKIALNKYNYPILSNVIWTKYYLKFKITLKSINELETKT